MIDKNGINTAGSVTLRDPDDRVRDLGLTAEKQKFTGCGILRIDRKIHTP